MVTPSFILRRCNDGVLWIRCVVRLLGGKVGEHERWGGDVLKGGARKRMQIRMPNREGWHFS